MPDIADARAAYRDALRRAEEEAGITRDPATNDEVYSGETPDATPELEGAVPVQASDQPLTEPDPTPTGDEPDTSEEEAPPVPETPATDPRDVRIQELEARLAEKESFIGRQSTEIGELRSAVEEIRTAQQTQVQPQAPQAPAVPITQDLIDADPQRATLLAFEQGNTQALEIAFEAWRDEDPFTAAMWVSDRRLEAQQQAFDAKIAELDSKLQTTTEPLRQNTEQATWNTAFAQARAARPDFMEHAERLLTEVAPNFPHIVSVLSTGDAEARAEVLTALYDLDRVANPERLRSELQQQAEQAAAEAEAARQGAAVVAGQTTAGQPAVEKTADELEAEAYAARWSNRPSLSRGWTGRKV